MAYNKAQKKATINYLKDKQKTIAIHYKKDYFDNVLQPAITKANIPLSTFVKQAVDEKLHKDGLI